MSDTRTLIKLIRDGVKSQYKYADCCEICKTTEKLELHHYFTIFFLGIFTYVKAIGESIDNETLGGAVTHTEISGIADYKFKTEQECLDQIKRIVSKSLFKCYKIKFLIYIMYTNN
jgi:hypothetical protein